MLQDTECDFYYTHKGFWKLYIIPYYIQFSKFWWRPENNSFINIATNIEIPIIMQCQISSGILSYIILQIVLVVLSILSFDHTVHRSSGDVEHSSSLKVEINFFLFKFWYVPKNQSVMVTSSVVCGYCYVIIVTPSEAYCIKTWFIREQFRSGRSAEKFFVFRLVKVFSDILFSH